MNVQAESEKVFAAIRAMVGNNEIKWNEMPRQGDGFHAFSGVGPGLTVIAAQANVEGRGVVYDGAATVLAKMLIVHLTPEMSKFCYEAATSNRN